MLFNSLPLTAAALLRAGAKVDVAPQRDTRVPLCVPATTLPPGFIPEERVCGGPPAGYVFDRVLRGWMPAEYVGQPSSFD